MDTFFSGIVTSIKTSLPTNEFVRQTKNFTEVALMTYEDLVNDMNNLNELIKKCLDQNKKHLLFTIKRGTDSTILWKTTIKICCIKIDAQTRQIDTCKLLNLVEFYRIYKSLQMLLMPLENTNNEASSTNIDASTIIHKLDFDHQLNSLENDCCICFERKPEIMLVCEHSYCSKCIEKWNFNHNTCPICRKKIDDTDESWVIPEKPNAAEINEEINSTFAELGLDSPD